MIGLHGGTRDERVIVFSDVHHPYHDKRKVSELIQFIKSENPTTLVNAGDFHDCKEAGRFVENCLAAVTMENGGKGLPDLLFEGVQLSNQIAAAAPKARKVYVPGNHEVRIHKQLQRIRHIIGSHDPLRNAWAAAKPQWEVMADFPDGRFVISESPLIEVWHQGRGTGQHHAASAWRAHYRRGASVIYGDTHKPLLYLGQCSPNPRERDERFACGIGTFADISNLDGFGYATEAARSEWSASVALVDIRKSGRITIDSIPFP